MTSAPTLFDDVDVDDHPDVAWQRTPPAWRIPPRVREQGRRGVAAARDALNEALRKDR